MILENKIVNLWHQRNIRPSKIRTNTVTCEPLDFKLVGNVLCDEYGCLEKTLKSQSVEILSHS